MRSASSARCCTRSAGARTSDRTITPFGYRNPNQCSRLQTPHGLRGGRPAVPENEEAADEPNKSDTAPEFKSQLMAGAIADRFKSPGMDGKSPAPQAAGGSTSQGAHVKTKLKIH